MMSLWEFSHEKARQRVWQSEGMSRAMIRE